MTDKHIRDTGDKQHDPLGSESVIPRETLIPWTTLHAECVLSSAS